MLVQQVEEAAALERRPAHEQRVEDDAERIEVAALGDRLARGLLGRDELGGADDAAGRRQVRAGEDLGDAEVGELDLAVGGAQDVRRLEVAVDDAVIVDVPQGRADCRAMSSTSRQGSRFCSLQDLVEALALDVLHGVEVMAVLVARFVEADDVGMAELAEGLDLALEALQEADVLGQLAGAAP